MKSYVAITMVVLVAVLPLSSVTIQVTIVMPDGAKPRAGFEPATTGLQGRRYTGLSYRGPPYGFMCAK